MSKKTILKVNESQMNAIINYINENKKKTTIKNKTVLRVTESQLKSIQEHINKEKSSKDNVEVLEEGWKDIVLGVALLAGVSLGGQSKLMGQSALDNNYEKIVNTIQNDANYEKVISTLEKSGLKNAEELLNNNKEINQLRADTEIGDKFSGKKVTKKSTVTDKVGSYDELADKLKHGYVLSKIGVDTLHNMSTDTIWKTQQVIDSLEIKADVGDYFDAGKFILSDTGKVVIDDILKQIKDQNGQIVGVYIESSTDKQRVSSGLSDRLTQMGYAEGNEGLSTARNNQLKKYLTSKGIPKNMVKQEFKWDEGKGELGAATPQDPSARYVKMVINVIVIDENGEKIPMEITTVEDVLSYNFEVQKENLAYKASKHKKNPSVRSSKIGLGNCTKTGCYTF